MTNLSHEQEQALDIAHRLIDLGVPIFTAYANHSDTGGEFIRPNAWQTFKPNHRQVELWKPGHALCMVTGVKYDVIDIDPRNGGKDGIAEIAAALEWDTVGGPHVYGQAKTPSDGEHVLIGRTMLAKGKPAKGIDLMAGDLHGEGRGYIYIAPTVRVSKYGPRKGQEVMYEWTTGPSQWDTNRPDDGLKRFVEYVSAARAPRTPARKAGGATAAVAESDDPFDYAPDWTQAEAERMIQRQLDAVRNAKEGEVNGTLGGAARVLGRFMAGGYLTENDSARMLLQALEEGGVHSDQWNAANRKDWTGAGVIGAGLANGADEPWSVEVIPVITDTTGKQEPDTQGAAPSTGTGAGKDAAASVTVAAQRQRLQVLGAADSAYWLQNAIGSGPLAGFFLRAQRIVHTPLIGQDGYVGTTDGADNGPAQIQPVTPGQVAAKVQYAYSCYKTVKVKGKDGAPDTEAEVPALFPLQAAQRAVDAPESMGMLRPLNGITLTPMVRPDGSVLGTPGYDPVSGYLFLPGPGVNVPPVPAQPTEQDVAGAVGLLDEMLAGFPWETKDDRANYLGMLLTPLLRLVTPPSYKMFGIGAHQPGSGKTLLADIATTLHGGVLRSEVPEDEPEWRKQTTSILVTTSAPIVHIDNVTGILKSSVLAGLLTAGQEVTDRELGSTRMITTTNDRVWVVTGNNLSLGGDLIRRTIVINIDPNMANPERREFPINDLPTWVREHRNRLLWSLLVMIRRWVADGMPQAVRQQSDSFARWEASVAGILASCHILGDFDHESGKRAQAGGDDDGLVTVLTHLYERFEGREWTVAQALDGTDSTDVGDFVAAGREWLPDRTLSMLARSEAAGRKSFGRFLLYSIGRWVTDASGSYVLRQVGAGRVARWRVEKQ